jgi:hypothetical protein
MGEFITTGYIRSGRLEIRRRRDMQSALKRMRDGEVFISIIPKRAARSQQQNRWYWGVVVELLSDHTGYTPDEIHEVLKAKFLPKRLSVSDGNGEIKGEFVIGGTTARLDKVAFGEFCESVRQWAADELGVVIPDPDTGALWTGVKPQHAVS